MIFAMVGTHEQPFDRLMLAVEQLRGDEPCIVQYGYSTYIPKNAEAHRFMDFDQVKQCMTEAAIVIIHAGTGSAMLALSLGKFPIVAPRYQRYGEHVDDHQLQLVETLAADGLIVPYLDGGSLDDCVSAVKAKKTSGRRIQPDARLIQELRTIIDQS